MRSLVSFSGVRALTWVAILVVFFSMVSAQARVPSAAREEYEMKPLRQADNGQLDPHLWIQP